MPLTCYCCTCEEIGRDAGLLWDAACPNHGAHGVRGCEKHGTKTIDCDCGCDYKASETRVSIHTATDEGEK